MDSVQFAIFTAPGGALIADYSGRIENLTCATNNRGYAECTGFVPLDEDESFLAFGRFGTPHVQLTDSAAGIAFQGRLEDVEIVQGGIALTALGYSRSLGDAPYTALWSTTDISSFRPMLASEEANCTPDRYAFDTNNRVYITPVKGAVLGNTGAGKQAMTCFQLPDDSTRDIIGASFDYVQLAPAAAWRFFFQTRNANFTGIANAWGVTGGIGISTGNVFVTFAAARIVNFFMDFNAADAVFAGETGSAYLIITNLRLVTSTANMINTTTTAIVGAGANVSVPVVSSARMYVGQRLHMGTGGLGEGVVVESVPDATHFVADLTAGYASGQAVQAHIIYADEIAKHVVSEVSTLNPTQLASTTALIQSPGLDLLDEVYEDMYPSDILDYLVNLSEWEWGVRENQRLYFRPQGSAVRTWYIDISVLQIQRLLDQLANSVYAVYQEPSGRRLRTAITADAASVARYELTRRIALPVSSTSATQAATLQAAALSDGKDPKPRSGVTVDTVFDANGARWSLWHVCAGDTVIIRNLPPTLSTAIDRVRVFRLSRAVYDGDTDTLSMEPESPLPSLDAILSRVAAPSWVTTPWWVQIRQ